MPTSIARLGLMLLLFSAPLPVRALGEAERQANAKKFGEAAAPVLFAASTLQVVLTQCNARDPAHAHDRELLRIAWSRKNDVDTLVRLYRHVFYPSKRLPEFDLAAMDIGMSRALPILQGGGCDRLQAVLDEDQFRVADKAVEAIAAAAEAGFEEVLPEPVTSEPLPRRRYTLAQLSDLAVRVSGRSDRPDRTRQARDAAATAALLSLGTIAASGRLGGDDVFHELRSGRTSLFMLRCESFESPLAQTTMNALRGRDFTVAGEPVSARWTDGGGGTITLRACAPIDDVIGIQASDLPEADGFTGPTGKGQAGRP